MHEYNPEKINYLFNLAVEQYAEMELVFQLDLCPYSQLQALCVGVKNGHFIARASLEEMDREPVIWGSDVNCYFSVRDVDAYHFYFKTRLARLYNAPPNAMFMVFPLPHELAKQQRRFSRRATLDETIRSSLAVWHSYLSGGDATEPPKQNWQGLSQRGCEVGEISANGMRLDMEENNPLYPAMFIDDKVLLRGNFGSLKKPAILYILGNIVRKLPRPDVEGAVSVGCHFTSWRKADTTGAWFRADPRDGIAQVAQWISRNFHTFNS